MRFDLEYNIIFIIKFDDARVIGKRRDTPSFIDGMGCTHNRAFEQPVNDDCLAAVFGILNQSAEGLVDAMLRPGLRQSFKFNIGRVSLSPAKVGLNCLHFGKIQ